MRALLALSRGDSTGARRVLAEPDSTMKGMPKWTASLYTRPLAAQAYFLLGDYQRTLRVLQDFEPEALRTGGFDSRWGMLGRVRLLRAAAYEQLGRRAEARQEYRQVLSPVEGAPTQSLQPFVRQAEQGLARLGEAGKRALTVAASRSQPARLFVPRYICRRWPSVMVAGWSRGRLEESPSSTGQTAR